jgi:hypothetical protein
MKFRLFVSFLLCFLSFSFFAQKGHLIGKVVDEKSNSPILYVTVSLQNILDSSLVSGVITDEQGRFKIQNIILDKSKPNGTPRKILNYDIAKKYGWKPKTTLDKGFDLTLKDFIQRH